MPAGNEQSLPQKNSPALPVRCINCRPMTRPIFCRWVLVATRPMRKGEAPKESRKERGDRGEEGVVGGTAYGDGDQPRLAFAAGFRGYFVI